MIDPAACSITSALSMTTATPASAPLAPGRGAMPSTPVYPRLSPSTKESTPLSRHKTRYSPFKLLPTSLASRRQLKTICPKLYFQKIVRISTKKKKNSATGLNLVKLKQLQLNEIDSDESSCRLGMQKGEELVSINETRREKRFSMLFQLN